MKSDPLAEINGTLWALLRENAPELFDTGQEHGPWLYGDTRKDHGPYPWMKNEMSYNVRMRVRLISRGIQREIFDSAVALDYSLKGLSDCMKSDPKENQ